jgi:plastocyanin
VLQDSLGLTTRDRVHRIDLVVRSGRQTAVPALVEIRPGDHVDFHAADHYVHLVRFEVDSLDADARAWWGDRSADGPPLLTRGTRWVLEFGDAPPGRYTYVLDGNRDQGRGAVVVGAGSRF